MSQPDVTPASQPPDYAVLGLSPADEVVAQWVTTEASDALARVLACERAGLFVLVLELNEVGAMPLEAREVTRRALAAGLSGDARGEARGGRDLHAEAGRWLAGVLSATAESEQGTAVPSWDVAAARWSAYFPHLPSSEVMTLAGFVDQRGWEGFRTTAEELIDLLRHMDAFGSDSSTGPAAAPVRPLPYYVRGFRRLRTASDAVPELKQPAEAYLLQAVRSSPEAAEVAGFVGASSVDMFAWAQDRFGGDPEAAAAAQTHAALWQARRQLTAADQRSASVWLSRHPSVRREPRIRDTWSAHGSPRPGLVGSDVQAARRAEFESAKLQIQARYALWAYLAEHEADLTAPDPVRPGRERDRWLRHREEAERLALAAYVSVEHAAADLERALNRAGAALESAEDGFAEFASEWTALQQAWGALRGLLPGGSSEMTMPALGWGQSQRSVPVVYRLVRESEDGVTSEPLAAALWWLRRDRSGSQVSLSCSDDFGGWQLLTVRQLLQRIRYPELSTQQRAELDVALAVWLLEEGERSKDGRDWSRMGRRWAEVLSDAPPRATVLTRIRALGHGKAGDVAALQHGAALASDGDGGPPLTERSTEDVVTALPERSIEVPQTVLLESAQVRGASYIHAALRESSRTVVAVIRRTGEGMTLADSNAVDTSRLFAAVVERVSGAPEADRTLMERQVVSDEMAAYALRAGQMEQAPWVAYLRDIEEEYLGGLATLAQYTEAAEQAWHQLVQLINGGKRSEKHGPWHRWFEVSPAADASGPGEVHLDLANALCAWARRDRPDERFTIATGEVAVPGRSVLRLSDVPVTDLIDSSGQVISAHGPVVAAELASWVHHQARSTAVASLVEEDTMAWKRAGWAWGLEFGTSMPTRVADELVGHRLPGETAQAASRAVVAAVERGTLTLSAAESRRGWLLLAAAAKTSDEAVAPSRAYLDKLLPAEPVDPMADDSGQGDPFLTIARRIAYIAQQSGAPALGTAYRAASQFGEGTTDLTSLPSMPSRMLARAIEVQKQIPSEAERAFHAAEALSQAAALLAHYVDAGYPDHALTGLRQSIRDARGYLSAVCRQQAAGLVDGRDLDPLGSASTGEDPRFIGVGGGATDE